MMSGCAQKRRPGPKCVWKKKPRQSYQMRQLTSARPPIVRVDGDGCGCDSMDDGGDGQGVERMKGERSSRWTTRPRWSPE